MTSRPPAICLGRIGPLWGLLLACVAFPPAAAADPAPFSPESLEFFEKQVRPLLAEHCYSCHSRKSKEIRGGLRVDSRHAMLRGGDTGPAIVPKNAKESLLIDAVRYGDIYQMPPKYRLPAAQVSILEKWVSLGAPWPAEDDHEPPEAKAFDLAARAAEHWAWRPIGATAPPLVRDAAWPRDPLDRYVLAGLEQQKLHPSEDAAPMHLLRRVHFDLVGLPPSADDIQRFQQVVSSQGLHPALEAEVNRLLDSPQFGERWGRHWLDLMRYAESRGHEFDYDTANAWQFRDYVIRAFNANVPYDQLLKEHLAGDLLPHPRRHPELGFNESVLATGFWHLGEWVHSPVDIRKDETDRMDNAIDVFSKAFLGMTVACARCHDHKFDAISQKDYYALVGFLQSSAYRQVRFETQVHNQQIADALLQLEQSRSEDLIRAHRSQPAPTAALLRAAVDAVRAGVKFAPQDDADVVFADFETGKYHSPGFGDWTATGDAFGEAPVTLDDIAPYQGKINLTGRYFVNSHNIRIQGAARGDAGQGTLTSPPFNIQKPRIEFWIGGGAHVDGTQLQLLVDGKAVRKSTGKNNNQMHQAHWDVAELIGKQAKIQAIDQRQGGWGNIGFDHIVFTSRDDATKLGDPTVEEQETLRELALKHNVDAKQLQDWTKQLLLAADAPKHPLRWLAILGKNGFDAVHNSVRQAHGVELPADASLVADFGAAVHLWSDGPGYVQRPAGAIDWSSGKLEAVEIGHAALRPVFAKLKLRGGVQRDPGALGRWDRSGKTLRTGSFELTGPRLHYLIQGECQVQAVVDSHRTIQGPLHGALVKSYNAGNQWKWVTHDLTDYQGHRLHIEFSPKGDQPIRVSQVVIAPSTPKAPTAGFTFAKQLADAADEESFIATVAEQWNAPKGAWLASGPGPNPTLEGFLARKRELESSVQLESQTAPAMWDGAAENEFLLVRGNSKNPADFVPRRSLEALGGDPIRTPGSGRLALAEQLLAEDNPLVARVFVNRVWHHLMGRGIVPSVDNFGVLGEEPTNLPLLDHLAIRFRESGWDIKRLIHDILLSRTYRMSSEADPAALERDPTNRWLHHMPLRRLEGEAIRDSMLALSGRLDLKPFGPSVPVYLTEFMQGRGRPGQGPLDGNGRRSIYISVRRNFLSPMMLAFDTPQPTTAIGRRTVSNVPAQALILLNDPFVLQQAAGWAKRLAAFETVDSRLDRLYLEGLAREPNGNERQLAKQFLKQQAVARNLGDDLLDEKVWTDLCHAMFNLKEFIYLP